MEYELHWVAPFRYLRINGCLLLPEAFRSLPRLSSAPSAKAFTLCSFLLDLLATQAKLVSVLKTIAFVLGMIIYSEIKC